MYPELHLVAYRRHEHELVERLERRRVAEERAGSAPAAVASPAVRGGHALTATLGSVRAAAPRLVGRLTRARHAVREASAPTACCSPA